MKKLVLACMVLFVVAALTAPAQAVSICFKWTQFCDGVQVDHQGLGGAQWYHYDCSNNSVMDASPPANFVTNCGGPNGKRLLRSKEPNGPGNYYFIVDQPADGNLDMHQGQWPGGTCWINDLAYDLLLGPCSGAESDHQAKPETSSIQ